MARSRVDDRKLQRLLRRLEPEIQEPVKKAVDTVATAVLTDAQANVPVKTGALKRSIRKRKTKKGLGANVGSSSPYAHLVELGTAPHNLGQGGHHPGAKPKPYLRPALDKNRQRGKDEIAKAVNEAIRKAARGA